MYAGKSFVKSLHPLNIIISLTLLCGFGFISEGFAQELNYDEIRREAERRYLSDSGKNIIHIKGSHSVSAGETIDADIVITDGDIEINGEVLGTVIVINGNMLIERLGVIRGNAIAISGKIIQKAGGIIVGNEIETSWRNFVNMESQSRGPLRYWLESRRRYEWEDEIFGNENVMFRYNRVEGLFLGTEIARRRWYDTRIVNIYGNVGYGFKSEEWRYTAGMDKHFFNTNRLVVGVKSYDLTDSDDFWRIEYNENTLAALFLREDFLDFYNRRGFTAYINQEILNNALLRLEYRADTFKSMRNSARWSVFGGSKVFRPNPSIDEGNMRSINVIGLIDTRNSGRITERGWWIRFDSEYTSPDLGGDFDYARYMLDLRRYKRLNSYENLNFRLMFGASRGLLPIQRMFYLGGISTLRGMKYKELSGSHVFLTNVEYLFNPRGILTGPSSWFLEDFKLALFFDAGAVMTGDIGGIDDYFDKLNRGIMRHNVGIGITTQDEDLRVNFAWRTDIKSRPLRVTLRLTRSF